MKKLCALALCLMMAPIAVIAMPMKWDGNLYSGNSDGSNPGSFNISYIGLKSDMIARYKSRIGLRLNGRIVEALSNRSNLRSGWSYPSSVSSSVPNGRSSKHCDPTKSCATDVPEPGSLALLGLGLVGLGLARRRLAPKS